MDAAEQQALYARQRAELIQGHYGASRRGA